MTPRETQILQWVCIGLLDILVIVGWLYPEDSKAGSVQIHAVSEHSSGCETCNEQNLGLGWRGDGAFAPMAGFYDNSCGKISVYGGANLRVIGGLSLSGVGVSGYDGCISEDAMVGREMLVTPMVHYVPGYRAPVSPMLTWAPNEKGGVVLFSINVRY